MREKILHKHKHKYVAFCDILGFSAKVMHDFDTTQRIYKEFTRKVDTIINPSDIEITIYSDAILITSDDLMPLLQACQILNWVALSENMLLRGGISYGKYWEEKRGRHLCVVSDALIKAVKIEESIKHPIVKIDDDIDIPLRFWAGRFTYGQFVNPVLNFRGNNIVNPFNKFWGYSAGTRARILMEESSSKVKEKYQYFLDLYDAVNTNKLLIPQEQFKEIIKQTDLTFTPYDTRNYTSIFHDLSEHTFPIHPNLAKAF